MAAFEKSYGPKRDVLTVIAELDSKAHKVSSFGLTENSTAELDLHLLNAVINDETQVLPEKRLRLAVEWNRKDVVERVLRGLRSTTDEEKASAEGALRGALQCAVELRAAAMAQHDGGRVQIIKLLVAQNPSIVSKLDFLALYRSESRIFLDSPKLWQALATLLPCYLATLPPYHLTTVLPYHLATLPPYYLTYCGRRSSPTKPCAPTAAPRPSRSTARCCSPSSTRLCRAWPSGSRWSRGSPSPTC